MTGVLLVRGVSGPLARFRSVAQDFVTVWVLKQLHSPKLPNREMLAKRLPAHALPTELIDSIPKVRCAWKFYFCLTVHLVPLVWRDQTIFGPKVNGFAPDTSMSKIVSNPDRGRATNLNPIGSLP